MRGIEVLGARNAKGRSALRGAEFAVELSSAELLLLFATYGPGPVLGVGNIFQEMSLDEVEAINRTATVSLRRRGILRLDPDGKMVVHARVEELVRTCIRPEHTLIVRLQEKNAPPQYEYVHFVGNLVVLHSQPRLGRNRLSRLAGRESLESMFMTGICGARSLPPTGSSFSMPEKALFEVRDQCRSGREKTALDRTLHYCPERMSAARLVKGLKGDATTHSLVLLSRPDSMEPQHAHGFSVLTSPSGLWALRSTETNGEAWVEITPADSDGIRQRLGTVLPELVPGP